MIVNLSLEQLFNENRGEGINYYLVVHYSEVAAQKVYTAATTTNIEFLYASILPVELVKYSPILLLIEPNDSVVPLLTESGEAETLQGVIFTAPTNVTFQEVITHLRSRALIRFDGQRQGICHFQNPKVARYLFGHSSEHELNEWLGPLCSVSWLQHAIHTEDLNGWITLLNSSARNTQPEKKWELGGSQLSALELKFEDEIVHDFLEKKMPSSLVDVKTWKQFKSYFYLAEQLSLDKMEDVIYFLELCYRYQSKAAMLVRKYLITENVDAKIKLEKLASELEKGEACDTQ